MKIAKFLMSHTKRSRLSSCGMKIFHYIVIAPCQRNCKMISENLINFMEIHKSLICGKNEDENVHKP